MMADVADGQIRQSSGVLFTDVTPPNSRRLVPGGDNRQLDADLRTKFSGIGTEEECQERKS